MCVTEVQILRPIGKIDRSVGEVLYARTLAPLAARVLFKPPTVAHQKVRKGLEARNRIGGRNRVWDAPEQSIQFLSTQQLIELQASQAIRPNIHQHAITRFLVEPPYILVFSFDVTFVPGGQKRRFTTNFTNFPPQSLHEDLLNLIKSIQTLQIKVLLSNQFNPLLNFHLGMVSGMQQTLLAHGPLGQKRFFIAFWSRKLFNKRQDIFEIAEDVSAEDGVRYSGKLLLCAIGCPRSNPLVSEVLQRWFLAQRRLIRGFRIMPPHIAEHPAHLVHRHRIVDALPKQFNQSCSFAWRCRHRGAWRLGGTSGALAAGTSFSLGAIDTVGLDS